MSILSGILRFMGQMLVAMIIGLVAGIVAWSLIDAMDSRKQAEQARFEAWRPYGL